VRRWRRLPALALALLAACANLGPALTLRQPVTLLGEVHDNAAQHALRLRAFEQLLATGARPALAMEQFDRESQPEIDRLRAGTTAAEAGARADAIIRAAGAPGWQWHFYRPFIVLALRYRLPLAAASIGRGEARQIMRDGLAAHGFDADVPASVLDTLAADIEASHCGEVAADIARRMALAQVARDQQMARVLEPFAARGAVLLAGNGHVRTDVGAPRWLSPATRARSEAIGVLERGDPLEAYDRRVFTPAAERADPCAPH
jgi:uncharacterized iron-regulated protein